MGSFIPIADVSLELLKLTVRKRIPRSGELWNILTFVERKLYSQHIGTTFLSYGGVLDDSSIIACLQHRQFPVETDLFVTLSAPARVDDISPTVSGALEAIINWSVPVIFAGVEVELAEKLEIAELCKKRGVWDHSTPCDSYYFPASSTHNLILSVIDGVLVKTLEKSESRTVTNSWKFAGPGSYERNEDSVATIGSAGVYVKEGKSIKLVSWVILSHGGTINALYTHEAYRSRGFGKLTMIAATKLAADRGDIPKVDIEPYNVASKSLMEKIGYEFSNKNMWIIFRPS